MPLDRHAKRFVDAANAGAKADASPPSVEELRGALMRLATLSSPAPTSVRREDVALPGPAGAIPARVYSPGAPAGEAMPGLIYFHGGGWISGGLESHDALCANLSFAAQCKLVAVDFRLAPEFPFPAGLDDCLAATDAILRTPDRFGLDPRRIGVGGDSSGGGFATIVAGQPRSGGRVALQMLLCPVLDALAREPSRQELAQGYLLEEATMRRYFADYGAGRVAPDHPDVSPLRAADFSRQPPALVHVAEFDILRDEGAGYARALASAGVAVRFTQHAGMIHNFYGLGAVIPYAAPALAQIGAELRAAFAAAA